MPDKEQRSTSTSSTTSSSSGVTAANELTDQDQLGNAAIQKFALCRPLSDLQVSNRSVLAERLVRNIDSIRYKILNASDIRSMSMVCFNGDLMASGKRP